MANLSPELGPERMQGLRALSPFSSTRSNLSSSAFSSAVSSPSPLRMGLGNESFDAVSPILEPQRVSQPVSPLPVVPSLVSQTQIASLTNSARSTTYLSFPEDSDDEAGNGIRTQPPANLGASLTPNSNIQTPLRHHTQTQASPNPSPHIRHSHSLSAASRSLNTLQTSRLAPTSQNVEMGLGLFSSPQYPTAPTNVVYSPSNSSIGMSRSASASSASPSANASPSSHSHSHSFRHTQSHNTSPSTGSGLGLGLGLGGLQPAQSDGELSDLDLMSDYAPSESDFGNESDSSWSWAGGEADRRS